MTTLRRLRSSLVRRVLSGYGRAFARRRLYAWNHLLFELSVRGLGVLNYETDRASGEAWLIQRVTELFPDVVAIDIGASVGAYATAIKRLAPNASVYSFEPHPETFRKLQAAADEWGFVAINAGCGDEEGTLVLHDYADDRGGSEHASLYKGVIEDIHGSTALGHEVAITTVDRFLSDRAIDTVNLLKIDTEGHEYNVLLGAQQTLATGTCDVVHFEFNEMNIVSRRFLRDFRELLPGFRLHRLLPTGLLALDTGGAPLLEELFGYQNIIAIRPPLALRF